MAHEGLPVSKASETARGALPGVADSVAESSAIREGDTGSELCGGGVAITGTGGAGEGAQDGPKLGAASGVVKMGRKGRGPWVMAKQPRTRLDL